jgi:hypothetical protein
MDTALVVLTKSGVLFFVSSSAGPVCYVSFDGPGANALDGAWNWMPHFDHSNLHPAVRMLGWLDPEVGQIL